MGGEEEEGLVGGSWDERMMSYICLNVIDDYNDWMNSTDISDQLHNTYPPDHWMQNRSGGGLTFFGRLAG